MFLSCVSNISSQPQMSPELSLSQLQRRIPQFIVISILVIPTARRASLTIFSGRRGRVLGFCQRLKERWTLEFTTFYYVLFLSISIWTLITKGYPPVVDKIFFSLWVIGSLWRSQLSPSILYKSLSLHIWGGWRHWGTQNCLNKSVQTRYEKPLVCIQNHYKIWRNKNKEMYSIYIPLKMVLIRFC